MGKEKTVIAVLGTFDTKGKECEYIISIINQAGIHTLSIDTGIFEPQCDADISNAQVALAGGTDIKSLVSLHDRSEAMQAMSEGIKTLLFRLYREGDIHGVISVGGSGGTAISTAAMRLLPLGIPKVMVSTMASGDVGRYVGMSDIIMVPSIVDISGINRVSAVILANAAFAVAGMVSNREKCQGLLRSKKTVIGATMFGVTTPCVTAAKEYLENNGFEVLVFHANGMGGKTMEAFIEAGVIQGVLDITTTEWCDELFGGILSAGQKRCEAAAKKGIPQVVSVGAMDMINFGAAETLPETFCKRKRYIHNPEITLIRTTKEENIQLGAVLARKLNLAEGKTALLLPKRGISMLDMEGEPFYGPEEDQALFDTLRAEVDQRVVQVVEMDCVINDRAFAISAAKMLISMMNNEC